MSEMFDAFWRAVAYCLHPRVILLSLLPLLVAASAALVLGYFYWEGAVQAVRATLDDWSLSVAALGWLETVGGGGFRAVVAPVIVVALALPVVVIFSLLMVALWATPAIVALVGKRRFVALERKQGAPLWQSVWWSLSYTVLALLLLIITLPLWLVPPLVLVLPPLIWGWLTYKVFAFDVLADYASADERRRILREDRLPLLTMGIICGYLGAAPSLVWALSALTLVFAPLLIVVSVWLYTLVFIFSAAWFAHFALARLHRLRLAAPAPPTASLRDLPAQPALIDRS